MRGYKLVPVVERPACAVNETARRADALGLLAESFIENGAAALTGGDRNMITVHVSAATEWKSREIQKAKFVDGHHVKHWADGGETKPSNLQLSAENDQRDVSITARIAVTRWAGDSMDYGLAVEVLLQRAKRMRDVLPRDSA